MKISRVIKVATDAGIVDSRCVDSNFKARSRAAYKRNLANPGDCAGDYRLLAGLAVAEAYVGRGPGWIPEVQRIGCAIADKLPN